jgi:hypothetical protein
MKQNDASSELLLIMLVVLNSNPEHTPSHTNALPLNYSTKQTRPHKTSLPWICSFGQDSDHDDAAHGSTPKTSESAPGTNRTSDHNQDQTPINSSNDNSTFQINEC